MPNKGENIRKRKDGRWEGRYLKEVDGEKKYHSIYAKTYAEIKQKMSEEKYLEIEKTKKAGKQTVMPLDELETLWLSDIKMHRKYSTYRKYADIYENYIHDTLGNVPVMDITSEKVAGILPPQLSVSTHRSIYCVMNQIFSYGAIRFGFPLLKFQIGVNAKRTEPIEILRTDEQKILLNHMYQDMDPCKLGIIICLTTGLRLGEICSLKWEDIDFENQILHINRTVQRVRKSSGDKKTMLAESNPKTVCSKREIPLTEQLMELLRKFQNKDPYVIKSGNSPMDPRTYQYKFQSYLCAAGIQKRNFHILRHTFATNCISSGADVKSVSEILGHSSVNITLNKYVHPAMDIKRSCLTSLSSIYGQIMGQVS